MRYTILSPDEYKTTQWRNGRGKTTELCVGHAQKIKEFIWRLSIADVPTNGPFSNFSGYSRTLILLEGNGIELEHETGQVDRLLSPLDRADFRGDWQTNSRLINGGIKDFNIMTLRKYCSSSVEVLTDGMMVSHRNVLQQFFYSPKGYAKLQLSSGEICELPQHYLLRFQEPNEARYQIIEGTVLSIQIIEC